MSLVIGVESVREPQELVQTYDADEIADFTKEDVVTRSSTWRREGE